MNKANRRLLYLILTTALVLWMAACTPAAAPTEAPAAPTKPPAATGRPVAVPTATTAPTQWPTELPTAEPAAASDSCVECHRDKNQLIDTADPVEEFISENKGEG